MAKLRLALGIVVVALFSAANATPIEVEYEIGPYSSGGYSASWLHTASGCTGTGPNSGDTLYMCGWVTSATGILSGILDDGVFTITGGYLHTLGNIFDINLNDDGIGGSLGGDFTDVDGNLLWFLDVVGLGTFYFEDINMGPNYLGDDEFILWGQNTDAYRCDEYTEEEAKEYECFPLGLDLYGKRVTVPEPGTLALFSMGLLAMVFMTRRRRIVAEVSR